MKFTSLFSKTSPETESTLAKPNLGPVLDGETVSRYIVHDRHFSIKNKQVKAAAFEADSRGEKSVFRVNDLDEAARWGLGVEQVEQGTECRIQARGDIRASEVHAEALTFSLDPADHFRHANIVGWPVEKSLMKVKAAQLALKSKFVPRPAAI